MSHLTMFWFRNKKKVLIWIPVFTLGIDNLLYTDTRYNNKICYNDNLTVKKPSLKRYQLVTNYAKILYLIL